MDATALPDDLRFDQAPNVAAITSAQVLQGSDILHVYHMKDDHSWVFIHATSVTTADGKVIGMKTALELDPSLLDIADLPPGWHAYRPRRGGDWKRDESTLK